MKIKKLAFVWVVIMTVMMFQLQAGEAETVQKRFAVDAGKQAIVIYTGVDGDVFVEKHDKNEILFTFKKEFKGTNSTGNMEYFKKIHPEMDFANNTLTVEIKYPEGKRGLFGSLSGFRLKITATLLVPAGTDAKIKVVDGNIDVQGLEGTIALKSVDGDLLVKECAGTMKLKSVDGDIDVKNSSGSIDTHTTDGDVGASGVFSGIYFKSVDGEGKFVLQKGSDLKDNCRLRSIDGNICLFLHKDLAFKLKAKTYDGDIRIAGMEFKKVTLEKKNHLEAERGDAHYTMEIKTTDGDITLKEL